MRRVAAFCEDAALGAVVEAVVRRIASQSGDSVELDWHVARGGRGRVVTGLRRYARDVNRKSGPAPDLTVVGTDANCKGYREAVRRIPVRSFPSPVALAVPDPHVARWLLLDSQAFKTVFARGCDAPDRKCDKDRYKNQLVSAVQSATKNVRLATGATEFAPDIVDAMDIERVAAADASFKRFVDGVRSTVATWHTLGGGPDP